jgi:hypothetical protein
MTAFKDTLQAKTYALFRYSTPALSGANGEAYRKGFTGITPRGLIRASIQYAAYAAGRDNRRAKAKGAA